MPYFRRSELERFESFDIILYFFKVNNYYNVGGIGGIPPGIGGIEGGVGANRA